MGKEAIHSFTYIVVAIVIFGLMLAFATPFAEYAFDKIAQVPNTIGDNIEDCNHESTHDVLVYERYSATQHQQVRQSICDNCGKTVSQTATGTFQNHTYNASYVCTACGYRHTHSHTEIVSESRQMDGNNKTQHILIYTMRCSCGSVREMPGVYENHEFNSDKKCTLCGFQDVPHKHVYNGQIISETYLKSAATLSSPAVYYYCCGICGQSSEGNTNTTFTYGSPLSAVTLPTQSGTLTFTGTEQSPSWSGYDSSKLSISGVTTGTNAGEYQAIFTPIDGNGWTDGTTEGKQATWRIEPRPISVPAQNGTLTYNGNAQSPNWSTYSSSAITIATITPQTNPGTYTTSITLNSTNYVWDDGTSSAKSLEWIIGKGKQTIVVGNKTVAYGGTVSIGPTVTGSGSAPTGALSYISANTSVLTVTSEGVVTGRSMGASTIVVTAAETAYYESASINVTVTVEMDAIPAVPSQSGTLTYSGSSQSPSWTGYDESKMTIGGVTSGTAAGTYTATFTPKTGFRWSDGTTTYKEATWTIGKAAPTITATDKSVTYGSTVSIGATVTGDGTLSYTSGNTSIATVSSSGVVSGAAAGSTTITITSSETTNYSSASKTINLTVNKANATITATDKSVNYGSTVSIVASVTGGGTLSYSSATTTVATVNSSGVVTSVKPGTSVITINAAESANYNATSKTITVTVNKGTQTINATDKSVAYNGTVSIGATVTKSGSASAGSLSYSSGSTTYATVSASGVITGKKVGSTTITITAASTDYYNEATKTIDVTITAVAPTITATDKSVNYGSTVSIGASVNSGGTLTYSSSDTTVATVNSSGVITSVKPGTATITISAAANGNYTAGSKTITVTVNKGTQTINATDKSVAYNGTVSIGATVTKSGSASAGSLSYSTGGASKATVNSSGVVTGINVGSTTITITAAETDYYNSASKDITVTITAIAPTITATDKSVNYGSTVSIGASVNSGGTLTYSSSDTSVATVNASGVITSVKPGTATITINAVANGNYTSGSKTITVTVNKGTQTINATDKSVAYNGTVSIGATVTKSGSASAGSLSYSSGSTTYATVSSSGVITGKKVGSTTITITAAATDYYNEATKTINVTITAIAPTITATDKSVNYGSTVSIGASVNSGGTLTYSSSDTTVATVNSSGVITSVKPGTATITINAAANGNYTSGSKTVTVTVNKGTQTINATDKSVAYNGTVSIGATVTKSGSASAGSLSYSTGNATKATVNASGVITGVSIGSTTITITAGSTDYYNEATKTINVTITAIAPSFTKSDKSLKYGTTTTVGASVNSGGTLTYTSDNTGIVTVAANGTITPVSVGSTTITINAAANGNYSAGSTTINVTVTKGDQTVNATDKSVAYNETVSIGATVTKSGSASAGSLSYSSNSTTYATVSSSGVITGKKVGSTTITITVAATDYYNEATKTINVTITKATPAVTSPSTKSITYTGGAHSLLNAGTSSHGTWQYKLSGGSYSSTVPTGTDVGDYTVYYKFVGDSDHSDIAETSVVVSIAKASNSYTTTPSAKSLSYTGSAQPLINAGVAKFGTVVYSTDGTSYSTTIPTGTSAGSYTVYYKVTGTSNYDGISANTISVTIVETQASVTSVPTAKTLTYTGNAQALVNAGTASHGTMNYKLGNDGSWGTSIPTATNAGSYTVYYKAVGTGGYGDSAEGSVSVTIAKATMPSSMYPTAKSLTYSGSAQALVNAGTTVSGASWQYKLSSGSYGTSIPTGTAATSYTVYFKIAASDNYLAVSEQSVSVTIGKADSSISTAPTAKSGLTYNGSSKTLVNAGTASGGTMYYKVGSGEWGTSLPSATAPGTYTVYYKVVGDSNHNDNAGSSVTVYIRLTKVTGSPTSFSYDGSTHIPTWSNNYSTYITASGTTSAQSAVNSYTTTFTPKSGYTWSDGTTTAVSITWTISASQASVTSVPTAKTLTYTGSAQALVNAGTASHGTMNYKLGSDGSWGTSIPTATNAGSYTVYYKAVGTGGYGDSAEGSVSVTIAKATMPSSMYPTAKSPAYNGSAQGLVNAGTAVAGASWNYKLSGGSYSTSIPTQTAADTYTVYFKIAESNNYLAVSEQSISVTISKVASSISSAPTAKTTLVYTGSAQALINAGTASGGTMQYKVGDGSWSTSVPTATAAGTYTVYYKVVGDSNHNDNAGSSLTVYIRLTKVTATTTSFSYDASTHIPGWNNYYSSYITIGGITAAQSAVNSYTTTFTPKSGYTWSDGTTTAVSITWTISASQATVATAPVGVDTAYTGSAISLCSAGTATNGTMYYKVGSGSYSTTVPTATEAGTYVITYYAKGTGGYGDSATGTTTAYIRRASISTAPVGVDTAYKGSAISLCSAGTASNGTMQYKLGSGSWSNSIPTATDPGTYTISYRVVGNSGYGNSATGTTTAYIRRASVSTAPVGVDTAYTGSAISLCSAGTASNGTMQYKLGSGSWGNSIPTATDPGTYTISYRVVGNSGYGNSATGTTTAYIRRASVSTAPTGATSLVYSGSAQNLLATNGTASNGTMQYKVDSGSWGNTATATNAGTYTVYYRALGNSGYGNSAEGSISVTIARADMPSSMYPTARSLSYNGSAQNLVNAGSTVAGASWNYKLNSGSYSTTIPQGTTATTYTVYFKIAQSNNYNAVSEQSLVITINSSKATVTTAPTGATSLVYNGSSKNLLATNGTASNGTMQYKVGDDSWGNTATATNAGTYTVYYKAAGTSGYADSDVGSISVTIARSATLTKPSGSPVSFDYDGSTHIPVWSNYNSSYITIGGTTSAQSAIGNYSTTFTPKSNYAWSDGTTTAVTVNWSISGTAISRVTGSPVSWTYDGSTHIPTWTNYNSSYITIGGTTSAQSAAGGYSTTFTPKAGYYWSTGSAKDTITISWTINRSATLTKPSGSPVSFDYDGSTHIPVWSNYNSSYITIGGTTAAQSAIGNYSTTFTPKSNYAWSDGTTTAVTVNWSISGTAISRVTGSPTSFAYDGNTHIPTWTNYNSSYITIGSTSSAQSVAGTYTTTFTPKAGYYWSTGSAKDTITITWYVRRASVTTAPTGATSLVYSGSAQNLLATNGTASNGTMQYKVGAGSWGNTATATNAGTYTVYYRAVGNSGYGNSAEGSISVTISPKSATITVDNASRAYGTSNPAFTGTVTGLVNNSDLGTISYSTTATSSSAPGSYAITASYTANSNYNVTVNNGTLTISKATPSVSVSKASDWTYDGSAHNLIAATPSSPAGTTLYYSTDNSSWSTSIPTATNWQSGGYTVYYKLSGGTNYSDIASTSLGVVNVNKKSATITVDDASRSYNTSNPTFTGTVTGLINEGDLGTVTYSTTATSSSNVGSYTITASYTANSNYSVTVNEGTLTISAIAPTITASNKAVSYGNTVNISATVNSGGTLTYSSSDETVATVNSSGVITSVKPGSATITITAAASGNYTSGSTTITVTVSKGTQTINATDKSVAYNSTVSAGASVTKSGSAAAGSLSYSSASTTYATVNSSGTITGKKVGSTTITITAAETAYYNAGSTTITVTINAIAPTITASNKSVDRGSTVSIGATVNSGGTLTYTSNNTSIATVNASGVIRGVAAGTTTITINAAAKGNYTAGSKTITVTVTVPTTYTWNKYNVTITGGTTQTTYVYEYHYHSKWDGDTYETVYLTDDDFTYGALEGYSPGTSYINIKLDTYDYEEWTLTGTTTQTVGGTQTRGSYIGTVTSTNSSAYPNNGVQGNYWYVKQ